MKIPVLVIGQVLGLGFLTRYSGTDAVLGLAFTSAGAAYPFFAAYLGWLGVFLTGSDTASNALFGSLQRITAQQLNLNEVLIVATNSTGGVMGKMIDAQSIMVACAACYESAKERRARARADLPARVVALGRRRRHHRADRAAAGLRVPGRDPAASRKVRSSP